MSKKSDAAVGRLAVMDGALNELLRDLVTEIGPEAGDSKKVAENLLQVAKSHPALFTKEMTKWLEGKPVDRSAQAVAAAAAEFRDLIDEGVKHARVISEALNERAKAAAQEAVATGKIQSPRQVLIGQTLHRCANCSPGGNAIISVALPTAAALLPPES